MTYRLHILRRLAALLLCAVASAACSEEATQEPAAQVFLWDTSGKEDLSALILSAAKLGFGYFRGDDAAFTSVDADSHFPKKFSTAFLRVQMSDELKIGQEGPNTAAQALFAAGCAKDVFTKMTSTPQK